VKVQAMEGKQGSERRTSKGRGRMGFLGCIKPGRKSSWKKNKERGDREQKRESSSGRKWGEGGTLRKKLK